MRAGRLHVRRPESKETATDRILLVLDSYLPKGELLDAAHGGEEILDALVLARLGIAPELVERGNRVTLLAAATRPDGGAVDLVALHAKAGGVSRCRTSGPG